MPRAPVRLGPSAARALGAALWQVRAVAGIPDRWPAGAAAEAAAVAARGPVPADRADRRDLPLLTIDPPGSRDLDQALHLERRGPGYRVQYAIADVGAFVRAGGSLDAECRRRGMTVYLPDRRVPLHPDLIGEAAASLLPGRDRPAVLWSLDLDADGGLGAAGVGRAWVRSRARLSSAEAQAMVDRGSGPPALGLLREVGVLRQARERERGGVSLDLPAQEVVRDGDGYMLRYEAPLPVEGWNAQVSLLTGMAAAGLMATAGLGLLRTMPPADPRALARLRRMAAALGVDWPEGRSYSEVVRACDAARPRAAAFLTQAARTLRGAGYTAWAAADGPIPEHAAVAAPYAHVTAPIRRLADRFAAEVALAAAAGREVPDWVREALSDLPGLMQGAARRARAAERAALDHVEAALLAGRVGERFPAVVVDLDDDEATVQIADPAVVATMPADGLALGEPVTLRLAAADPARGAVVFAR